MKTLGPTKFKVLKSYHKQQPHLHTTLERQNQTVSESRELWQEHKMALQGGHLE